MSLIRKPIAILFIAALSLLGCKVFPFLPGETEGRENLSILELFILVTLFDGSSGGGEGGPNGALPYTLDLRDLTISSDRLPRIQAHDDIPVDTSTWTVHNYAGDPYLTDVSQALAALPENSILRLPAGTYTANDSLASLYITGSNRVISGDCSDRSAVVISSSALPEAIGPCSRSRLNICGFSPGFSNETSWTAGLRTRGTRFLTVQDASGYRAQDWVLVSSNSHGFEDLVPQPYLPVDLRQMQEFSFISRVEEISGNRITIDRGLPIDLVAENATVSRFQPIENAGIQCLTVNNPNAAGPGNFYQYYPAKMSYAVNSWFYNVDFGDTFNVHSELNYTARSVIAGSRYGRQVKSDLNGGECTTAADASNPCYNKTTLTLVSSHDNSFINNVIDAYIGVQTGIDSTGNWIAYNYFSGNYGVAPEEPRRAFFQHGTTTGSVSSGNLVEGNVMQPGAFEFDAFWGSPGPLNTIYRNVFIGPSTRGHFFVETRWFGTSDHVLHGLFLNFLANHVPEMIDLNGMTLGTWVEKNRYDTLEDFAVAEGRDPQFTTTGNVRIGETFNAALPLPNTLNFSLEGREPVFWCANAASFQIGDPGSPGPHYNEGTGLMIPAQLRAAGTPCL